MTVAELKKIWEPEAQGKITHWNQIRPEWPNEKIALFGAGADSGTFDYFTEAIVGKAKASRGDYTASEDDNVLVQGIEGNKYALGYIPYAYFAPHSVADEGGRHRVGEEQDTGAGACPARRTCSPAPTTRSRARSSSTSAGSRLDKPEVKEFVEFYLKNVASAGQRSQVPAAARQRLPDSDGASAQHADGHAASAACPKSACRSRRF